MNQMSDHNQSQSTWVKQQRFRLFDFNILLEKLAQLKEVFERAATQSLRSGDCHIEDIMTKLEEARVAIPRAAPSQGIITCFDSRAMDLPSHERDRITLNDESQKHPSGPDTVNPKPEREKDEVETLKPAASFLSTMQAIKPEPEREKDGVDFWKLVASSLSTMQPMKLEFEGESKDEIDILKLPARCMSTIQTIKPEHEGERALPGNDFITTFRKNNANKELEIKMDSWEQMERVLSGIPNAPAVAFFILSHLQDKHHVLFSCSTIFTEEHTPSWRRHILFEKWTDKENNAFVSKFSLLVPGRWNMKSVLQKWHELLEVS
jgi:hypothetical protein